MESLRGNGSQRNHALGNVKNQVTDDVASKASSSSTGINHISGSDPDPSENPKDIDFANLGSGEAH